MSIFIYFMFAYGLSNILVYGYGPFGVVDKFRKFCSNYFPTVGEMLECMMCTSANIGLIMSILNVFLFTNINFTPANSVFVNLPWYLIVLFDMFATSGVVWLAHTIQEYFEGGKNND